MFRMMQAAPNFISCEIVNTNHHQPKAGYSLNRKGIGSSPDPFQGGTYNLQLINTTLRKKGLVHETRSKCHGDLLVFTKFNGLKVVSGNL